LLRDGPPAFQNGKSPLTKRRGAARRQRKEEHGEEGETKEVTFSAAFLLFTSPLTSVPQFQLSAFQLFSFFKTSYLFCPVNPIPQMMKTTLSILLMLLFPLGLFAKDKSAPTKEKLIVSTEAWTG
jgi:hypothetical protein